MDSLVPSRVEPRAGKGCTRFLALLLTITLVGWSPSPLLRADDVDDVVGQIQDALDLTHVNREVLREVLTSESVEDVDYLTIARDVVVGVQVSENVTDGNYGDALKSTGKWGSKKALKALGYSSIATIWTAVELASAGLLWLVEKGFDEPLLDQLISSYVYRREHGESDEEAWWWLTSLPGMPSPTYPLEWTSWSHEQTEAFEAEWYDAIHKQCLAAWRIHEARDQAYADKERFRGKLLRLLQQYAASGHDLSGRWSGTCQRTEDGLVYEDKVTILQSEDKLYLVKRRRNTRNDNYIVTASDSQIDHFLGEYDCSGPPQRILEQVGTWEWASHVKRSLSDHGETITLSEDYPSGRHQDATWLRDKKLAAFPRIGQVAHEFKGLVELGEEVLAGEMTIGDVPKYLLLILNYPGSKLTLTAIDPGGHIVSPQDPGVTYLEREVPARMYVRSPKAGTWSFRVTGVEIEGDAEPFWLLATFTDEGPEGAVTAAGLGPAAPRQWQQAALIALLAATLVLGAACLLVARRRAVVPLLATPVRVSVAAPEASREVELRAAFVRIGRAEDNDIVIADAQASAYHAVLRHDGANWTVEDLGSTNGTFVNGRRVTQSSLSPGDRVTLGSTSVSMR